MKSKLIFYPIFFISVFSILSITQSSGAAPKIKEENVTYTSDGVTLKGYVAYDENIKGKRPAIVVVPEWWGLNDYPKSRARQLASLGYIAIAADMFGNGKIAANPTEAQELSTPFYQNPELGKERLDAAIEKIKGYSQTDVNNVAAIGYCFGGAVVLNGAKLGLPLKGVVSFHGGLPGVPPKKELLKAKILVCHGAADKFVTQQAVNEFKHQMDSVGAKYTFIAYANATHAFTNPAATATGKKFNMPIEYNAKADKDSWNDMKTFFISLFKK